MKALTVQQPWAWAIIHGGKDIENRTQAWSYRGPLAIHAGLAKPEKRNLASVAHRAAHGTEVPSELVFGAVIGSVDLVGAHVAHAGCCPGSEWAERDLVVETYRGPLGQKRSRFRVHLVLENPRPVDRPIPCAGKLGLWTPPAEILDQLHEAAMT